MIFYCRLIKEKVKNESVIEILSSKKNLVKDEYIEHNIILEADLEWVNYYLINLGSSLFIQYMGNVFLIN